jgi:lysophospholipase L1-like esterase
MLMVILAAAWAVDSPASDLPWLLPEWRYRQVFEVVPVGASARINTGSIELPLPDGLSSAAATPRVLDESGQPVEFQRVDENGEPLDSTVPAEDSLRLFFHIVDPSLRRYVVYYDNPKAESLSSTWERELAGLVLETRENPRNNSARNWEMMVRMVANSRKRYGKGERRQINDSENPFGPDDQFLSTYRGLIYCPEEGTYDFGTDSDDSSFLLIDGEPVAEWPGAHSESGRFDHYGRIDLKAGAHRIEYYHVQCGGGTLARAGWRPPGARAIEVIPESAFIREVRTEPLWIEGRDNPCSALFRYRIDDAFQFGSDGPGFVKVRFENRSRSALAPITVNEWHFGDGAVSLDVEPVHLLRAGDSYEVVLRVTDALGYESVFRRALNLAAGSGRRVDVRVEVGARNSIVDRDAPLDLTVKCNADAGEPLPIMLATRVESGGRILQQHAESVTLPEKGWTPFERNVPPSIGADEVDQVVFEAAYMGAPVDSTALRVLRPEAPWDNLTFTHGAITDETGANVVVRLSGEAAVRDLSAVASAMRAGGATVVVLDDLLAGRGNGGYPELLAERLRAKYASASINVRRIALGGEGGSHSLMRRLPPVLGELAGADLIVLSASLRDVLHFIPVEIFERELQAVVEKIAATTDAAVLLVAPPPTLTNPGLSQAYAIAVKRVGLRLGVPVADAQSAFVKAAGADPFGWGEFYRDPRGDPPVYTVAPGAKGQELIADLLEKMILSD